MIRRSWYQKPNIHAVVDGRSVKAKSAITDLPRRQQFKLDYFRTQKILYWPRAFSIVYYYLPTDAYILRVKRILHNEMIMRTMTEKMRTKKDQKSALVSLCEENHWWLVDSPHKGTVTRKIFPFDDVIMSGDISDKVLSDKRKTHKRKSILANAHCRFIYKYVSTYNNFNNCSFFRMIIFKSLSHEMLQLESYYKISYIYYLLTWFRLWSFLPASIWKNIPWLMVFAFIVIVWYSHSYSMVVNQLTYYDISSSYVICKTVTKAKWYMTIMNNTFASLVC